MENSNNYEKNLVVKSNALINAMFDLTLQGNRFLAFAISLLDRRQTPEIGQAIELEIPVMEFANAFELDQKNAYREIQTLADQLQRKIITLQPDQTLDGSRVKIGLISKQKYHDGEGRVWFRFDEDLVPHILGLKDHFTKYRIKDVYQFSRTSSWRLYELLKQYKDIGKREIEIDDLKTKLRITGKYDRISNLKNWVLKPSIEEINSTSDIKVQYDQEKRGRRVVSFVFYITKNEETMTRREKIRDKLSTLDKGEDFCPELAKRMREEPFKVSPKQARELANIWSKHPEKAHAKLDVIAKMIAKGDVKSPGGYTFSTMKVEGTQHSLPIEK
jgi:plasmid replication initiation protein